MIGNPSAYTHVWFSVYSCVFVCFECMSVCASVSGTSLERPKNNFKQKRFITGGIQHSARSGVLLYTYKTRGDTHPYQPYIFCSWRRGRVQTAGGGKLASLFISVPFLAQDVYFCHIFLFEFLIKSMPLFVSTHLFDSPRDPVKYRQSLFCLKPDPTQCSRDLFH